MVMKTYGSPVFMVPDTSGLRPPKDKPTWGNEKNWELFWGPPPDSITPAGSIWYDNPATAIVDPTPIPTPVPDPGMGDFPQGGSPVDTPSPPGDAPFQLPNVPESTGDPSILSDVFGPNWAQDLEQSLVAIAAAEAAPFAPGALPGTKANPGDPGGGSTDGGGDGDFLGDLLGWL
jgi:hypothetical protein